MVVIDILISRIIAYGSSISFDSFDNIVSLFLFEASEKLAEPAGGQAAAEA